MFRSAQQAIAAAILLLLALALVAVVLAAVSGVFLVLAVLIPLTCIAAIVYGVVRGRVSVEVTKS